MPNGIGAKQGWEREDILVYHTCLVSIENMICLVVISLLISFMYCQRGTLGSSTKRDSIITDPKRTVNRISVEWRQYTAVETYIALCIFIFNVFCDSVTVLFVYDVTS